MVLKALTVLPPGIDSHSEIYHPSVGTAVWSAAKCQAENVSYILDALALHAPVALQEHDASFLSLAFFNCVEEDHLRAGPGFNEVM